MNCHSLVLSAVILEVNVWCTIELSGSDAFTSIALVRVADELFMASFYHASCNLIENDMRSRGIIPVLTLCLPVQVEILLL